MSATTRSYHLDDYHCCDCRECTVALYRASPIEGYMLHKGMIHTHKLCNLHLLLKEAGD